MLDVLWMILMMPEMPDLKPGPRRGLAGPRSPLEVSQREWERREQRKPARSKAPPKTRRSRTARPA